MVTESTGQATEFSGKRALIVDDSKSARAFLARMLEKHGIEVDTAETAEQAIVYLARTRPDVIFMDHLMPGMDGFQAVQSIKNNPRTATIPIMMFTSQEGELYLGQARALGALGVLPKQVKPTEVSTVLHQLRLVPDRRRARVTSFEPGNAVAHEAFQRPAASIAIAGAAGTGGTVTPLTPPSGESGLSLAQLRLTVDEIVREQVGELRRSWSTTLDEQSERIVDQLRELLTATGVAGAPVDPVGEALFAAERPAPARARAAWGVVALMSLAAAVLAVLWWQQTQANRGLAAQLVESRATRATQAAEALQAAGAAASGLLPGTGSTGLRAATPAMPPPWTPPSGTPQPGMGVSPAPMAVAASATALSAGPGPGPGAAGTVPMFRDSETVQPVPYGEVPMAGDRLESLRRLLDDLATRGFRGRVAVTSFPGRFCLVGNGAGGFELAAAEAPLSRCELIGNPFDDQLGPAQREPLPLANLVGALRQRTSGAVEVQLVTGSETQRVAGYPEQSARATASEWNRAAASNNRVEIRIQPAGT